MLIAYLTTDELNQHLALQMAEECGETLCPLSLNDVAPDGEFDAVVYDWDFLPSQQREAILKVLLTGRALLPVAVHSYKLDEDLAQPLRRQGVAVYRHLQPEIFRLLTARASSRIIAGAS